MSINQNERKFLRLVTGASDPRDGSTVPAQGCLPTPKAQTGKFSTVGTRVIGDGDALFDSEVHTGDFLYATSLNAVREVLEKHPGNILILDFPFPSNVTDEDVKIVRSTQSKRVIVKNTGASAGAYQEVPLAAGEEDIREFNLGCAPATYDANGTTFSISISE